MWLNTLLIRSALARDRPQHAGAAWGLVDHDARPFAPVLTFWQTWSTEPMTEARLLEQWQRRAAGARELFETSLVMARRSFLPDELARLMTDSVAAQATVLIS